MIVEAGTSEPTSLTRKRIYLSTAMTSALSTYLTSCPFDAASSLLLLQYLAVLNTARIL